MHKVGMMSGECQAMIPYQINRTDAEFLLTDVSIPLPQPDPNAISNASCWTALTIAMENPSIEPNPVVQLTKAIATDLVIVWVTR